MTIGVGGGGYVGIAHETTMGTYVPPTIFVPILSESLQYNEDRYYSPAIRQAVIMNDVKQSYYSVGGEMQMEVDTSTLPYFMHCARTTMVKTGAATPWTYKYTPASGASSGIGAGNATQKTMSITIVRNNRVFKYCGCVVPNYTFMVEDGVLKFTANILGLSETGLNADTPPVATFTAPKLLGANAHIVSIDVSGVTPTFTTPSFDFGTFEFEVNDNGEAQNRIRNSRGASYISFGECEIELRASIDFQDRLNYEDMIATNTKAFRLESTNSVSDKITLQLNRAAIDQYNIPLSAMGDIIIADVTAKGLNQAGGDAFVITVISTASIT